MKSPLRLTIPPKKNTAAAIACTIKYLTVASTSKDECHQTKIGIKANVPNSNPNHINTQWPELLINITLIIIVILNKGEI